MISSNTTSISEFGAAYQRITKRIYGESLVGGERELDYLKAYNYAFWYGDEGCIAAIINTQIRYENYKPGLIGFFEFADNPTLSRELLNLATGWLIKNGCDYCIGPMNGDTWHKYRVTLPHENEPVLLDNRNPAWYYDHYKNMSFAAIGAYISFKVKRSHFEFERVEKFAGKFEEQGITIREFNLDDFAGDLQKIYQVSIDSFANNFLYTPISFGDFRTLYYGAHKLIDPRFVLLAEKEDQPLGFVFAVPNMLNPAEKELAIKSLAVVKRSAAKGLGSFMMEMLHKRAWENNYNAVYHLLMHKNNVSTKIASSTSELVREYALFGKELS